MFFATGRQGYTVQSPLEQGKGGVVAGDLLLDVDAGGVEKGEADSRPASPSCSTTTIAFWPIPGCRNCSEEKFPGTIPRLRETDMAGVLKAIRAWRADGIAQQFFMDPAGRRYAAAFQTIPRSGPANLRVAVVAPVDEFYAGILSERGRLFAATLAFVAAMVPIVFFIGSLLSRSLRALADETDRIQRFEPSIAPPVRSMIREIDDLGRSVSTMRTMTETFSRFVPRRLVERLIETGTPMQLGGTRREVTLLFSDIKDFTEITEKAEPTRVMQYTSRYFAAMSQEIMSHSGTVDKFIGDAIMAIWNAPADDPDHAANACAAALAFQRANAQLNAEFAREGWPAYRSRIGLHSGEAVVGNIGSEDRMNYTALGATVNLAARLEGLNKNYGTAILVSSALKQRAGVRISSSAASIASAQRDLPKRSRFTSCDARARKLAPTKLSFAAHGSSSMRRIRAGPLAVAEIELSAFLAKYPDDSIARYHKVPVAA